MFRTKTLPDKVKHYYFNSTTHTYYYGYCIDLLFSINESMKFDFTLVEPPDGMYGAMQADGSWNGMVNELIQDVSDGKRIFTIIILKSVCLSVVVRKLQVAILARSSREISQTVRIDCRSFLSRVRISVRPSTLKNPKMSTKNESPR